MFNKGQPCLRVLFFGPFICIYKRTYVSTITQEFEHANNTQWWVHKQHNINQQNISNNVDIPPVTTNLDMQYINKHCNESEDRTSYLGASMNDRHMKAMEHICMGDLTIIHHVDVRLCDENKLGD